MHFCTHQCVWMGRGVGLQSFCTPLCLDGGCGGGGKALTHHISQSCGECTLQWNDGLHACFNPKAVSQGALFLQGCTSFEVTGMTPLWKARFKPHVSCS